MRSKKKLSINQNTKEHKKPSKPHVGDDVSETREPEELLFEYELLQRIMDTSPVGILVIDREGKINYANKLVKDTIGIGGVEIHQRLNDSPYWQITDIEGKPANESDFAYNIVFNTGQTAFDVKHAIKLNDGRMIFISINASPLFDKSGHVHSVVEVLKDVTKEVKANKELQSAITQIREEKARTEAIIAGIGDGITIQDTNFKIIYQNQVDKDLIGEHVGEFCYEAYRGRSSECPDCQLQLAFSDGQIHRTEWSYDKEGGRRYVTITASPVRDANGKIIAGVEVVHDITSRKNIEEQLRAERDRAQRYLDIAGVMIVVLNADETVALINDKGCEILGFSEQDIIGCNWFDEFVSADNRENLRAMFHALFAGEADFIREHEAATLTRNGPERLILWQSKLIYDENGKAIAVLRSGEDITQRREMEIALRESEERYRRLIEMSPDAIAVHSGGKFVFVNPAGVRLIGASGPEDIIGSPVLSIMHPDYVPLVKERVRGMTEEKKGMPLVEEKFIKRDGSVVDVEVAAAPLEYQGNPAIQVVARDVSVRKQAEAEVKSSYEKLKRSMDSTIKALAMVVETRDSYTAGHQQRVSRLASAIAAQMHLPDSEIESLRVAGLLHDIGKISVPAEILSKPGKISPGEYNLIKTHPQASYEIIKEIEFPWPITDIILQHHERMDGSGYPKGLMGDQIRIEARILAVCDVLEAMSSRRPYRSALGFDAAMRELEDNKGVLYDSEVVEACQRLFKDHHPAEEEDLIAVLS